MIMRDCEMIRDRLDSKNKYWSHNKCVCVICVDNTLLISDNDYYH